MNFVKRKCHRKAKEKQDDEERADKECYEFVLPISFNMPDGSKIDINIDEDWHKLDKWNKDNRETKKDPEIIFPFDVILDEQTITINNKEEFKKLESNCDNENGKENDNSKECIDFILPISYKMPDGSVLKIENDNDWGKYERWLEQNKELKDEPKLIYPVDVLFNGEKTTVNDNKELEELERNCKEE